MLIPPLRIRLFTAAIIAVILSGSILGVSITDASAQGPIRRLGDRLRQRAADQTPPAQRSPRDAAESPANPVAAPRQPDDFAIGFERRSSNFNRAAPFPPPASLGQRDSGWESRPAGPAAVAGVSAEIPFEQSDSENRGQSGLSTPPPPPEPALSLTQSFPKGRVRLGVVVESPPEVTPPGLPPRHPRGAWVTEVHPDSPADVAGMRVGDLIVAVNGLVVIGVQDLTGELARHEPGDELRIQYARDQQLRAATLALAGPDGIAQKRPEPPAADSPGPPSLLGGFGAALGGFLGGRGGGRGGGAPTAAAAPAAAPAKPTPGTGPEALPAPEPEIE